MASTTKRSSMVQVDREMVVTEGLVVMAVHVTHQEVKYGHVHDVQQPEIEGMNHRAQSEKHNEDKN